MPIKLYPLDSTKPFVLIDMDGTIFNIDIPFAEILAGIFAKKAAHIKVLPFEQLTEYHIEELYPPEAQQYLREAWVTPSLFAREEPIEGALEALAEMNEKSNLFICSSPRWDNPTCIDDKRALVAEHFGNDWLGRKRLFLVDDKTMVYGDYLIDDKPEIKGARNPFWKHIIYDAPYNRRINHSLRISWNLSSPLYWKRVLPNLLTD